MGIAPLAILCRHGVPMFDVHLSCLPFSVARALFEGAFSGARERDFVTTELHARNTWAVVHYIVLYTLALGSRF